MRMLANEYAGSKAMARSFFTKGQTSIFGFPGSQRPNVGFLNGQNKTIDE